MDNFLLRSDPMRALNRESVDLVHRDRDAMDAKGLARDGVYRDAARALVAGKAPDHADVM